MAEQKIQKTGFLWKQGGSFKSWKVRYFVLKKSCLEYYKDESDEVPKGTIDLKTGRGVRTRDQCDLEWPDKAKPGRCFGIALESRTFYFYGNDRLAVENWMSSIQELINKVGKPSSDCSADALSNSETKASKAMRGGAKIMNRMAKKFSKNKLKGDQAEKSKPVSDDGNATAVGSSVEDFYDDVGFDENESDNSAAEEVYDDVAVSDTSDSDINVSTEAYENIEIGRMPWKNDGEKRNTETVDQEATIETDEFSDDNSFTSEIYENITTTDTESK